MKKPKAPAAGMRWFRLYHDVMDDEKVQELPAELFKFWVNLLCLASKGEPRGRVPSKASTIAFRLRVAPGKTKAMLDKLESLALIDKEGDHTYVMHNWDSKQKKSDSGADRQKDWRDRHHNGESNVTDNVTDNVTGNSTVTGQEEEIASQSEERGGRTPPPPLDADAALAELDRHDPPHPEETPPEPEPEFPPVKNDPAEVKRVSHFAEDALGMVGYSRNVEQDAERHKIAYIEEAIVEARDSGKTDWRYVRKIYERFTRENQSNREKATKNGTKPKPRDSPPVQPRPSTTQALDPRIIEAAKRDTRTLKGEKG